MQNEKKLYKPTKNLIYLSNTREAKAKNHVEPNQMKFGLYSIFIFHEQKSYAFNYAV